MVALDALLALFVALSASATQAKAVIDVRDIVARSALDSIPSQCQDQCKVLADCTTADCICTSSSNEAVVACFQCVINAEGQSSVASTQDAYEIYADGCNNTGTPVPDHTFKLGDSGTPSNNAQIWGIGLISILSVSLLLAA